MKNLFVSLFAVVALSACGGRLDETGTGVDEDESDSADLRAQELHGTVTPPTTIAGVDLGQPVLEDNLVRAGPRRDDRRLDVRRADRPVDPTAVISGKAPTLIELDFSNGRIEARIASPDFVRDHLYSVDHQGGRCGCGH